MKGVSSCSFFWMLEKGLLHLFVSVQWFVVVKMLLQSYKNHSELQHNQWADERSIVQIAGIQLLIFYAIDSPLWIVACYFFSHPKVDCSPLVFVVLASFRHLRLKHYLVLSYYQKWRVEKEILRIPIQTRAFGVRVYWGYVETVWWSKAGPTRSLNDWCLWYHYWYRNNIKSYSTHWNR